MRFFCFLILLYCFIQPLQADLRFLSISDIHYGKNTGHGDGHDTNEALLNTALQEFSHLSHQVDFILTLGDFPAHTLLHSTENNVSLETIFHALYLADKAQKPMFYITGNNDSPQGNYRPFSFNGQSPLTWAPDWHEACVYCDDLLIDKTHLATEGYYSTYVIPGNKNIVLIALNSMPFAVIPFPLPRYPHQHQAAMQQLQWLKHQLESHHAKQVLIAMHIPPGMDYKGNLLWQKPYLDAFMDLLTQNAERYGEITLLTGHTHMDDIRKLNVNPHLSIYAYATPSISRIHHNHPGMKIFKLNRHMLLKDYTTYYTVDDIDWNKQYHAIQGHDSLFPQCQKKTLADCLDTLDNTTVCKIFEEGGFYGVKSQAVDASVCRLTYPVSY